MSTLLSDLTDLRARVRALDSYDFATASDLRAWHITKIQLELEILQIQAQLELSRVDK